MGLIVRAACVLPLLAVVALAETRLQNSVDSRIPSGGTPVVAVGGVTTVQGDLQLQGAGTNTITAGTNGMSVVGGLNVEGDIRTNGVLLNTAGGTTILVDGNTVLKNGGNVISVNPRIENKADLALFYREMDHSATYYKMYDYFADTFVNSSGVNPALSYGNTYQNLALPPRYNNGYAFGNCGYFNGTATNCFTNGSSWAQIRGNTNSLAFSWSFWFKCATSSQGKYNFIEMRDQENADTSFYFCNYNYAAGGQMYFGTWSGDSQGKFAWTQDTAWHHIVCTYTNKGVGGNNIYMDSVPRGTAASTTYTNNPTKMTIGMRKNGASGTDSLYYGYMDQILFFNRELSALDVTNLYYAGGGRFHDGSSVFSGLIAAYEFDEASGTNLVDTLNGYNMNTGATGWNTRVASTVCLNAAGSFSNMAVCSIAVPNMYAPTNYRTTVWCDNTNISQQVSRDGTNWNDVSLSLSGVFQPTATIGTNYMYYGLGTFTNVDVGTNFFIKTLATSNSFTSVWGHSISVK
jgi:hypothetical protein